MSDDDESYQFTPKGFFCWMLQRDYQFEDDEAEEAWHKLEAFCVQSLRHQDPDASFAVLVFDGQGGEVIGMEAFEE